MPEKETKARARKDKREGKSASTQAGEFVREEIEHVRKGKHGARSAKQAIAIGLSKARQAGVKVPPKKGGSSKAKKKSVTSRTKTKAKKHAAPSKTRSRAASKALRREGHAAGSHKALSAQAKKAARKRSAGSRSASARKAARTRAVRARRAK